MSSLARLATAPPSLNDGSLQAQIKLLLKTEHQLHRSQSALDRQLMRVELLSHFALRWDSQSPTVDIVADAAALFRRLFAVDRVVVAVAAETHSAASDAPRGALVSVPGRRLAQALAGLAGPLVAMPDGLAAELRELLATLGVLRADDLPGRISVVMPLRATADAPPMCLMASCGDVNKASHIREAPSAAAIPFLQLMSSHVEHTLRNSRLLADLAQAQARLLRAQTQLEERVASRTAELTREIAERTRTEAELTLAMAAAEQASVAKSAFLANMSHELRTPLNAIIGYSEMLAEDAVDAGQTGCVADIRKIIDAGQHLLALINDVLDLSKIEAGHMQLEITTFDLADLVRGVISTSMPLLQAQGNVLVVGDLKRLGEMRSDRTKLHQVLLNLVGNAAKFTDHGHVRVDAVRGADGWLEVRVADTGIGMTDEQQSRLFKEFSQADVSTTRRFGGTGLGLAISQRLCHLMGGAITVTGRLGAGSTFTVRVPIALAAAAADQTATAEERL